MSIAATPTTRLNPYIGFTLVLAAFGGVLYGYDVGISSGVLLFMKSDLKLNVASFFMPMISYFGLVLLFLSLNLLIFDSQPHS